MFSYQQAGFPHDGFAPISSFNIFRLLHCISIELSFENAFRNYFWMHSKLKQLISPDKHLKIVKIPLNIVM